MTPSAKPYHDDGKELIPIPESEWTNPVRRFADMARIVGHELLGSTICVMIVREPNWKFGGTFGASGNLVVNLMHVGHTFFQDQEKQFGFLIHEFGHFLCGDHLSEEYYRALTRVGAKMTVLALNSPEHFR